MALKREAALDFLRQCSAGHASEAFTKYAAPDCVHHNVFTKAGNAALIAAMNENAAQFPQKTFEPLRTVEEGNLVVVHSRVRLQPTGDFIALVHILKFDEASGRVTEMWDIGAPIPADSINADGAF